MRTLAELLLRAGRPAELHSGPWHLDLAVDRDSVYASGCMVPAKPTLDLRRAVRECPECVQRFGPDAMFCPFDGTRLVDRTVDATEDPLVGRTIDQKYLVVRLLGEGGVGRVYEVRHRTLDRRFALKILKAELAEEESLAQRFVQEARAASMIKHPNVVDISDFGQMSDGAPYLVMEFLTGQTIADLLKKGGPLPAMLGARITQMVASALSSAHAAGIIHRDLKPENVFLLGDPREVSQLDIRVLDFGAAKIVGGSKLTKAGVVFGTPHYMSPEQASGQPVDYRTDVYSLGVIMYEMFTGRVPFEGDTYMGVLTQHMFVQPTPPSRVSPAAKDIGALETVVLKALEKKPADRPSSMDELSAMIDQVLSRPGGTTGTQRWERAPAEGPISLARQLELPSLSELRAATEELTIPRASRWPWVGAAALLAILGAAVTVAIYRTRPAQVNPAPSAGSSATEAVVPSASARPVSRVRLTSVPPGASVWADGTLLGATPLDVAPRPSALEIRLHGHKTTLLTLPPGSSAAHVDLAPDLPPAPSIASTPKPPPRLPDGPRVQPTTTPPPATTTPRPRPVCDPDDPFCK